MPKPNGKDRVRVKAAKDAVAFVHGGVQYDVVEDEEGRWFEVPPDPELLEALRRHGHG